MNRRHFLQTGSLGALGFSLPVGILALGGQEKQDVHHWLQQLAFATGTRRRSSLLVWSPLLRERIAASNTFLAGRGFDQEGSSLHFYGADQSRCFYALLLQRPAAGLNDMLVPVLMRGADGSWQQQLVLTGYQIEALARATVALSEQSLDLQALLLPAGFKTFNGQEYATEQGRVGIKTQVQHGFATTEIRVCRGSETLFADTYTSRHCLRSEPVEMA